MKDNYPVSYYRNTTLETVVGIECLCKDCANSLFPNGELEFIDKAGAWDECNECLVQNIPSWHYDTEQEESQ